MDMPADPMEAFIRSPEASRDAASVHGSVALAVMDKSTERPLVFSVEVVEAASMEPFSEAFVELNLFHGASTKAVVGVICLHRSFRGSFRGIVIITLPWK